MGALFRKDFKSKFVVCCDDTSKLNRTPKESGLDNLAKENKGLESLHIIAWSEPGVHERFARGFRPWINKLDIAFLGQNKSNQQDLNLS